MLLILHWLHINDFSEYCPLLPLPNYSDVLPDSCSKERQMVGTTCQYNCILGYTLDKGTPARTCRPNLKWSAINMTCAPDSKPID